jgi:hypothetical protein
MFATHSISASPAVLTKPVKMDSKIIQEFPEFFNEFLNQ